MFDVDDSLYYSVGLFITSAMICIQKAMTYQRDSVKCTETYYGGCHCRGIRFSCLGPKHLVAWNCNCSICKMKKNWHFIIPEENFKLLSGDDLLVEYRFNTKVARHLFCKVCGVQTFYRPRSNPDGYAITLSCVDENLVCVVVF